MICKATVSDAGKAARLASKMWPSTAENALAADFEALIADDEAAVFLYLVNGEAVGFAQCQLRHDYVEGTDSSPVGYLEGVYIDAPYRKQGFGRALVDACQQWAKSMGCLEFASDCALGNRESLVFHLHAGFKEANRIICFVKKL